MVAGFLAGVLPAGVLEADLEGPDLYPEFFGFELDADEGPFLSVSQEEMDNTKMNRAKRYLVMCLVMRKILAGSIFCYTNNDTSFKNCQNVA